VRLFAVPDSDAARLSGDQGAFQQVVFVFGQNLDAGAPLVPRSEIHEPHNAAMLRGAQHPELAEVLIQRHEDALLRASGFEEPSVSGIFAPVSRPNHIMVVRF